MLLMQDDIAHFKVTHTILSGFKYSSIKILLLAFWQDYKGTVQ